MTKEAFLQSVQAIAAKRPAYRPGGDGSDGTCDCIGLIIGAIRLCGGVWEGVHGSNWAARHAVSGLTEADASALEAGQLVFKARDPSDEAWALPERYASHADQTDYYHVGVVTSVHPLKITHCTTPGVMTDTALGAWRYQADLCAFKEEEQTMETCTVSAASGSTVNLRKAPGGDLIARVPLGCSVTVTDRYGAWSHVRWGQQEGWMMSEYLCAEPASDGLSRLEAAVAQLEKRIAALEGR